MNAALVYVCRCLTEAIHELGITRSHLHAEELCHYQEREKKGVLHVNVLIVSGYFHPGSLFAGLCQGDIEDQARNKILQLFSKEEDKN